MSDVDDLYDSPNVLGAIRRRSFWKARVLTLKKRMSPPTARPLRR